MEGFKIKKKVIDEYKNIGNIDDKTESTVDNEINTLKYVKDTDKHNIPILDSEQMIEDWFPKNENNQVFISHSHEDAEVAKKLSLYLKK